MGQPANFQVVASSRMRVINAGTGSSCRLKIIQFCSNKISQQIKAMRALAPSIFDLFVYSPRAMNHSMSGASLLQLVGEKDGRLAVREKASQIFLVQGQSASRCKTVSRFLTDGAKIVVFPASQ